MSRHIFYSPFIVGILGLSATSSFGGSTSASWPSGGGDTGGYSATLSDFELAEPPRKSSYGTISVDESFGGDAGEAETFEEYINEYQEFIDDLWWELFDEAAPENAFTIDAAETTYLLFDGPATEGYGHTGYASNAEPISIEFDTVDYLTTEEMLAAQNSQEVIDYLIEVDASMALAKGHISTTLGSVTVEGIVRCTPILPVELSCTFIPMESASGGNSQDPIIPLSAQAEGRRGEAGLQAYSAFDEDYDNCVSACLDLKQSSIDQATARNAAQKALEQQLANNLCQIAKRACDKVALGGAAASTLGGLLSGPWTALIGGGATFVNWKICTGAADSTKDAKFTAAASKEAVKNSEATADAEAAYDTCVAACVDEDREEDEGRGEDE